eukprot:scaffold171509_cov33-Tisochrysis_lutea.AAC.4
MASTVNGSLLPIGFSCALMTKGGLPLPGTQSHLGAFERSLDENLLHFPGVHFHDVSCGRQHDCPPQQGVADLVSAIATHVIGAVFRPPYHCTKRGQSWKKFGKRCPTAAYWRCRWSGPAVNGSEGPRVSLERLEQEVRQLVRPPTFVTSRRVRLIHRGQKESTAAAAADTYPLEFDEIERLDGIKEAGSRPWLQRAKLIGGFGWAG